VLAIILGLAMPVFAAGGPGGSALAASRQITDCSTEAGIAAAFAAGGSWTFACSTAAAGIPITTPLTLSSSTLSITVPTGQAVTLNGGGREIIDVSGGSLTLDGLTLTDGGSTVLPAVAQSGAASSVVLQQVTLTDSQGPSAGAPITVAGAGDTLQLQNSSFSNNQGDAGGVVFVQSGDTLDVVDSTFAHNRADMPSGTNGATDAGGAIFSLGSLAVSGSTFTDNQAIPNTEYPDAYDAGGAIYDSGTATISGSSFMQNEAVSGGAIYAGSFLDPTAGLTVTASTFFGNSATYNASPSALQTPPDQGGAIYSADAITLVNSTLDQNSAGSSASSGFGGGGGGLYIGSNLYLEGGARVAPGQPASSDIVDNVTFASNTSSSGAGTGDNLVDASPLQLVILNTILSDPKPLGGNCSAATPVGTVGHDLQVGDTSCSTELPPVTAPTEGWVTGNPDLGPLTSQGGPTETMALLPGSAAIGAGAAAVCTSAPVNGVDQRGEPRTATNCDIGAYQTEPVPHLASVSSSGSSVIDYGAPGSTLHLLGQNFLAPGSATPYGTIHMTQGTTTSIVTPSTEANGAATVGLPGAFSTGTVSVAVYNPTLGVLTDTLPFYLPARVTVAANPARVLVQTGSSVVSGAVYDANGQAMAQQTVDLSVGAGTLGHTVVTTNAVGGYSTSYLAPATPQQVAVTARVAGTPLQATTTITVGAVPPGHLTVAANPSQVVAQTGTSDVFGAVYNADNQPMAKQTVDLSVGAGALGHTVVTTNAAGGYSTSYLAPAPPQQVTVTARVPGTALQATTIINVVAAPSVSITVPPPPPPCGVTTLSGDGQLQESAASQVTPPGLAPDQVAASCVFTLSGPPPLHAETLTLPFRPSDLGGLAPQRISVFRLRSDGLWTFLPTTVNAAADTASTFVRGPDKVVVLADVQRFADVPADYWARLSIDTAAGAQLVDGFPPPFHGLFQPNGSITRAQAVKMVVVAAQLLPVGGSTPFADVTAADWFYPYVAPGYHAGIVLGETPTTFGPNAPVTREAFAAMLARAFHLTGTTHLTFSDAGQISSWALPSVQAVVAAGYFNGFPGNTFQPLAPLTRAQASQVMAAVIASMAPPAE
jgi:hypothetical protein